MKLKTTNYKEGDLLCLENGEPLKFLGLEKTEMIYIEPGSFNFKLNEEPRSVKFDEGYFIGKYPVTNMFYQAMLNSNSNKSFTTELSYNPSLSKGDLRPVTNVSYYDLYLENGFMPNLLIFLSEYLNVSQTNFNLPSETQWEYAARGGKLWERLKFVFSGSNNIFDVSWFQGNSLGQIMPAGLKQANILGIYDMSGNIWEWCEDWTDNKTDVMPSNGQPNQIATIMKVIRGGAFGFEKENCAVNFRNSSQPENRSPNIGFRLALSFKNTIL